MLNETSREQFAFVFILNLSCFVEEYNKLVSSLVLQIPQKVPDSLWSLLDKDLPQKLD